MPRILTKTLDLPREEWLKYRRNGIGGSDAATVCGLNPYNSLIELWADKTGRLEDKPDNEAMREGRDFEEYVAKRFCEATGKKVRRRNAMFQHDTYDFILADIDREVVGENAGLECKTTNAFSKSDFENGEIPLYYAVQCRHYMNVMGYDKMYLAVLVLGKAFYWFEIPYDASEGEALLRLEISFWNDHIVPDVRPEPDGSESAGRVLEQLYHEQNENAITLFEQEENAREYAAVKAQISELEKRADTIKQTIITALDGNTDGYTEAFKVSWKEQQRVSLDSKKIKAEMPEIYEKYAKTTSSKVFRLAERKDK